MNEQVNKLKATLKSIGDEMQPLVEKLNGDGLSDEEGSKLDDLIIQFNKTGEDLATATNRSNAAKAASETMKQFTSQPAAKQTERTLVTEQQEQPKGWADQFLESQDFLDFRGSGQKAMSKKFRVDGMLDGEKALIYSGTPSASFLLPQIMPTIYRPNERVSAVRQALASGRTSSDAITVLQENVFTNSAAEVIEATATNNGAKPESAITFQEVTFPVQIVAHWIPVTRQLLEDLPMMRSYIEGRLRDGLERRLSDELLNGNGTPPNLRGILQTSGIQALDGTYFSGAPVKDAGTDNEAPNRIRRAKRMIRTTGGAQATFIIANPADTEKWDTLSTTTGEYLFGGPQNGSPVGRMWGLPVYEDEYIAAGTALVGDGTMAAAVKRRVATDA